jgi:hypothetical protein
MRCPRAQIFLLVDMEVIKSLLKDSKKDCGTRKINEFI